MSFQYFCIHEVLLFRSSCLNECFLPLQLWLTCFVVGLFLYFYFHKPVAIPYNQIKKVHILVLFSVLFLFVMKSCVRRPACFCGLHPENQADEIFILFVHSSNNTQVQINTPLLCECVQSGSHSAIKIKKMERKCCSCDG